ncbi:phosphatase PAP2 family protein [soil metagenome]
MDPAGVNRDASDRSWLERHLHFLRRRLSPGEDFGLHLTIGVLVVILGCWGFSEIAEALGPNEELEVFDQHATQAVQHFASPGLTTAMRVVSYFGSIVVLTTFSVVVGLLLASLRAWERLLGLALTMLGGSWLNVLLKHFFQRERPNWEDPLVTLHSFSFPSGHTMGSTMFYGFVALLLVYHYRRWSQRVVIVAVTGVVILAIGITRIYLGAHYLTDVVAAFVAGAAWLALCWSTTETLRRRRARRRFTTSPRPPPA